MLEVLREFFGLKLVIQLMLLGVAGGLYNFAKKLK